jgi:hypothetical protein
VVVSAFGKPVDVMWVLLLPNQTHQLADTAGLRVVGATYQRMDSVNPKTYVGKGKVEEIAAKVLELGVDTVCMAHLPLRWCSMIHSR